MTANARAIRGLLLEFLDDPAEVGAAPSYRYQADGLLVIQDGRIARAGATGPAGGSAAGDDSRSLPDCLILPGLIDTHIHYPQTRVIASYGTQLLEWLHRYTFVEEQKFADPAYAAGVAGFFLDEILRNGTTTAAVYCTTHPASVEAFLPNRSAAARA